MYVKNRISENIVGNLTRARAIRLCAAACCWWLLLPFGEASAGRDELTIGITQFPSTLNPNIDVMAAKSYVLGAALRPFTVYDAAWTLSCLLCVDVPTIERGDATPVALSDGRRGID